MFRGNIIKNMKMRIFSLIALCVSDTFYDHTYFTTRCYDGNEDGHMYVTPVVLKWIQLSANNRDCFWIRHELAITSAHNITQLKVPLYADPRRAAELSCHFEMEDQKLHSVKWYRDMNEIFRYNPSQKPSIRLFNITDVMVQGGECQIDFCMVIIMPPPISTRAGYTCEVSTEGPKFQIARKTKHMTVVAMPDVDPVISSAQKVLKPGESMFLNCSSDYSLPPADINWYIDDELQKPEAWERTELSPAQPGGLRRSWRGIRVRVPPTASGAIRARCKAILRVEPVVVREATTIITIHSRTQLSKYVSNNLGTKLNINTIVVIAIILTANKISRFTSL